MPSNAKNIYIEIQYRWKIKTQHASKYEGETGSLPFYESVCKKGREIQEGKNLLSNLLTIFSVQV